MLDPSNKINILLVDDRADGLLTMEAILSRPEYNLIKASSGEEALHYFLRDDFAVVLLDVQMPGMNGFETARRMHDSQSRRKTPIIFVTAISTEDRWVYAGYESGAVDYIFKPFDATVLVSKVSVFANMYRMQNEIEMQAILLQNAERKSMEQKLSHIERENLRRYQNLIDVIPHIIWRSKADRAVDYVNKQLMEYTGLPIEEILGDGWQNAVHPEDREYIVSAIAKAYEEQKPFEAECRIKRFDGCYRWHLMNGLPEFNLTGEITGWVGSGTDIHERKLIEEERRQIFELEQSARVEAEKAIAKNHEAEIALLKAKQAAEDASHAKSRLLANMSHEIRTPLGIILGFSEMLLSSTFRGLDRKHTIQTIINNGRQLAKLIDDILDISKVEAGHLEIETIPFSLSTLLSEIAETLEFSTKEKGISIEIICDASIPTSVLGDPTRIRQILINVMGNAVKFTEKGHIKVSVWAERPNEKDDSLQLIFRIADTGIGIPVEQQSRLFQDFMQADTSTTRRFGGTGLGLALSKRLAKSLGGDLILEHSHVDDGSVFKFWISARVNHELTNTSSPGLGDEEKPSNFSEPSQVLAGIKILLVDDAPDNQALVKMMLNHVGAEVDVASDGKEGVSLASENEYDVVLMDLQMPNLDGYEATRILRQRGFQKPIIALTAHAMKEERDRCLEIGFNDHFCKPIDFKKIFSAISFFSDSSYSRRFDMEKGGTPQLLNSNNIIARHYAAGSNPNGV